MVKRLLKCDHGCRLDDLKNTFEKHCEDLDEALDFSMQQYLSLTEFINEDIIPYLEWCAFQVGDETAHDLIIDLNKRMQLV
jgi:hypothetical protein